jgi:hypothetical protein
MRQRRPRHRAGCRHCFRVRLLGLDFQGWRASWEEGLEEAAVGYATEGAQYREQHAAPTFKAYLVANTGAGWPMSGQAPSVGPRVYVDF